MTGWLGPAKRRSPASRRRRSASRSSSIGTVATSRRRTNASVRGRNYDREVRLAPAAPKRTVGIASGAFWDKTSYVFGRTAPDGTVSSTKQARDAERLVKEHAAFLARHEKLLEGTSDVGCAALLAFLRRWSPERYERSNMRKRCWTRSRFPARRRDRFIHDRPAARAALMAEAGARDAGPEGMCLVTGEVAPIRGYIPRSRALSARSHRARRLSHSTAMLSPPTARPRGPTPRCRKPPPLPMRRR